MGGFAVDSGSRQTHPSAAVGVGPQALLARAAPGRSKGTLRRPMVMTRPRGVAAQLGRAGSTPLVRPHHAAKEAGKHAQGVPDSRQRGRAQLRLWSGACC